MNLNEELKGVQYASFPDIFAKFKSLSDRYGNLPPENLISAFGQATGLYSMYTPDPRIQNARVKAISSLPRDYTKDKVSDMLRTPDGNERPLRQVEHALEYTAYPLFHTRKVYQELLTYHNFIAPSLTDKEDTKKDDFWREWKLLEKLRREINPKTFGHEVTGQALQEGKVFYHPRISVDKAHNKVNHAFMQQLPSDWTKIVGFNNKSKYTIAFNLMYFTQPGTDVRQYGDLFLPYISDFNSVTMPRPKNVGTKLVYASKTTLNADKIRTMAAERIGDTMPDVYYQNGKWYYWVTLPIDEVFTFEVDDASRNAISPLAGMFLDMLQLAQLESIQLSLVQNPLVSVLTGEIPYFESKEPGTSDQYKLSNAGRMLFESLWYQMLTRNNTNGIGIYAAPLNNMQLHTLAEAPSAMDLVSKGYQDTMAKAGLAGIIPVSDEARAGMAQISLSIESKFASPIYACMDRMMNAIIDKLNLKYEFAFKMFGDLSKDEKLEDQCRQAMTLGILPATIIYDALHDISLLDDIAWSNAIADSEILTRRIPLSSTYTSNLSGSNGSGDNGEHTASPEVGHDMNPGGRPSNEGVATTDGGEGDIDSPPTTEE